MSLSYSSCGCSFLFFSPPPFVSLCPTPVVSTHQHAPMMCRHDSGVLTLGSFCAPPPQPHHQSLMESLVKPQSQPVTGVQPPPCWSARTHTHTLTASAALSLIPRRADYVPRHSYGFSLSPQRDRRDYEGALLFFPYSQADNKHGKN